MSLTYLALDGIDGAGKHEQIQRLDSHLVRNGITPVHLLEPSYGTYGREIRGRLRIGKMGSLLDQREMFTRDRRDHVERKIAPALNLVHSHADFVILQSRSYLAAAAYQGESEDPIHLAAIVDEQRSFAPDPDLILILDLPVDTALERLDRAGGRDSLENATILEKARSRYVQLAKMYTHCILIDADGTPGEVAERVRDAVFGR